MENKKEDDAVREHIARIVRPIFEKAVNSPSEPSSNQTLVGKNPKKKPEHRVWQPHNIRRYLLFSHKNFHPPNQPLTNPPSLDKGWVETTGFSYRPVNYGKEHLFMNWHWCNILVKKNQVSITYKRLGKQWFDIRYDEPEQFDEFVRQKVAEWDDECKKALALFIEYFGGESDFTILKRNMNDNGFAGDEVTDRFPSEYRVDTPLFKKEYAEKLEFKGTESMVTYVYNQALKKKEPEIMSSLAEIKAITEENLKSTSSFRESLKMLREEALDPLAVQNKWLGENIISHKEVLGGIKDGIEEEVKVRKETLAVFKGIKKALPVKKRKRKSSIRISALEKAFDVIMRERLKSIKKAYKEAFGHDFW